MGTKRSNHDQKEQCRSGDGHRARAGFAEVRDEEPHLPEEAVTAGRDAGEPRQLVDDHDQGDSGQVADEDGTGQKVRHETQPQQPRDQTKTADSQCERGGQARVARGVAASQRRDHRRGHQRRGGLRSHRQRCRRTEQGIRGDGRQDRPQPGDRRQPGHGRVGHHLGHQVGDHRRGRQQVRAEPSPPVSARQYGLRHPGSQPPPRRHVVSGAFTPSPSPASVTTQAGRRARCRMPPW